jgi:hypothetical protein
MWEGESRIYRPRQVYIGPTTREYVPVGQRKLVPIPGMSGAAATSGICK